ncbi:MAG: 4Fe-4S binding protein [Candidatus Thorarchaeota archaeon]
MAEDAETSETIVTEETEPVPEEEPKEVEKKTPKEGKSLRAILGYILNIRMLRRIVQIAFLLGINGYIFTAWFGGDIILGFWTEFSRYLPTLPIIAPLEAPAAVLAGSFDTLQRELTSAIFPFFTLGAMIIILTILGRSACGWICPIGTIQDFATLPNRSKVRPSPNTENEMRRVKTYLFIIVFFLAAWVGISKLLGTEANLVAALGPFADAAFAPWNPANIVFFETTNQIWPSGFDNLWVIWGWSPVFWLQLAFIGIIVVVSFWFPRWFCRWLCPAGWFYSIFSRDALIGIGRNPARCTPDTCNVCEVVCPMNIQIRKFPYKHMHSSDCIMCLDCKSHCPNKAIQIRFG